MSKVTLWVKELVDQQTEDDETTATQLHRLLNDNGINSSLRTVLTKARTCILPVHA